MGSALYGIANSLFYLVAILAMFFYNFGSSRIGKLGTIEPPILNNLQFLPLTKR